MRVLQLKPNGSKVAYLDLVEVELTGTQRITTTYYSAGAQMIATRVTTSTSTLSFIHTDHLGSTSFATNISGTVLSKQLFYPYGEIRYSTGVMPTTKGYTGQYRDGYIKLILMGRDSSQPKSEHACSISPQNS